MRKKDEWKWEDIWPLLFILACPVIMTVTPMIIDWIQESWENDFYKEGKDSEDIKK